MRALLLCLFASSAAADDHVSGFVAYGAGTLTGHVTAGDGQPLAGVEVHVVSRSGGDRIVKADKEGYYRLELVAAPTEQSMVFVKDHPDARVSGETAETVKLGTDGEAIEVHATLPPPVMAKPVVTPDVIPDYSDAAIDKNVWAKAWLLLEISATGAVEHLKFVKRPGYDLDAIAVRDAFKLKFEPARDRANHATRSLLLWSYEWPSYYWLLNLHVGTGHIPPEVSLQPCQKPTGRQHAEYRDCSGPNMAQSLSESWIAPRRTK